MTNYDQGIALLEISCEGAACTTSQTFNGSFRACIEQAKDAGWRLKSDDGRDWHHYCSASCADQDDEPSIRFRDIETV